MKSIAYVRNALKNFGIREKELKKLYQYADRQFSIQPHPFGQKEDVLAKDVSYQLRQVLKDRVLCKKLADLKIFDFTLESMETINRGEGEKAREINAWTFNMFFNDRFYAKSQVTKEDYQEQMNLVDVFAAAFVEMIEHHEDHLLDLSKKKAEETEAMDYTELEGAPAVQVENAPPEMLSPWPEDRITRDVRKANKRREAKEAKKRMKELKASGKLAEMAIADLQRKKILKHNEELRKQEMLHQQPLTENQVKAFLQMNGRIPMSV